MDTIFALASGQGRAGVAVVRLSGPLAFSVAEEICGVLPGGRGLRSLRMADGENLDQALVLVFAKDHSFTGEETVEFHTHGSPAVVKALLSRLGDIDGVRLAEPGEFTRRALENGRLDLSQVEGLADLIEAETEAQRKQAVRVFSGALGKKAAKWRQDLVRAMALLAATIDFADEEVPHDVSSEAVALIEGVRASLERERDGIGAAERIRDGFEVAIVGPPNVGKSTLLNYLAGREAAITSEIAGTTRDVIEVRMDIGGLPVTVLDTAGLRETHDSIEEIGVRRAVERALGADLRVFLTERGEPEEGIAPRPGDIVATGKGDLGGKGFLVSGATGLGVEELVARVRGVLADLAMRAGSATRARHLAAIRTALDALESARIDLSMGADRSEFSADELQRAVWALDVLVGRVDVENVLDEVFSSFCLGK